MEYPILFESLSSPFFSSIGLSAIAAVLSIAGIYYFTKNRTIQVTFRNLGSLLCFFAFMMSAGSVLLGWFFGERIGDVLVYRDKFETPYGEIKYDNVKNIIMKKENTNTGVLNPQLSGNYTNRLIILTKTGDEFLFSEKNYPVKKMIGPMRKSWSSKMKKDPIK